MDGKRLKALIQRYWLVPLVLLILFLRIPLVFEPFTYGDEGIYLTLGQAARKGLVFYQQIHDNKPPLLYLIAALTGTYSAYRAFFFTWSLAAIWLFYQLTKQLFPKNKLAVIGTTLIFVVGYSLRRFEGTIANAENFLIATSLAGFLLFLKAKKFWHYLLVGFFFSLSTLFKVPAAFDFAALLALVVLRNHQKTPKSLITNYLLLITGFTLPIILSFVYYASQGALADYLKAAFAQNLPYLSSWLGEPTQAGGLPVGLLVRAGLIGLVFMILFFYRKRISSSLALILLWFSFALFAALLSSRPYPHYLLQVIPALSLSCGLFFEKKLKPITPLLLALILILVFNLFHFWHYPSWDYLQNFYQFVLGAKNKNQYYQYFGEQTPFLYQAAKFIALRTSEDERAFVWGTQPSIYALANRLPTGRYTTAYHIIDFGGKEETITALNQNQPRFIVIDREETHPFPAFFQLVENNYFPYTQFGNFQIYGQHK